jgi:F420-dependent oxidoreductase-like protein
MAVDFGVFVPQGWRMDLVGIEDPFEQYEAMTRVGKVADETGAYDSIWVYDHFHTVPRPTKETTFEAWTITAGLARDTKNVKIGQMVTCNGYRNPALYAKIASTVDAASHGRLYAGIGAGWYEHEWRAYGYGFPEARDRVAMLREACEIIHRMWIEDYPEFRGRYYTIDKPINEPKGVQKPHPPLWIGGGGENVTLRVVARFGDACNVVGDPDTVRHKLEVLKRHCEEVGRDDHEEIIKSTGVTVQLLEKEEDANKVKVASTRGSATYAGTPEMVAEELQALVDAGIDYFIVTIPRNAYDHEAQTRFAREVVPIFTR